MKTFCALWKREMAAMFLSPIAYVMMMFFLLVTGCGFYWLVKENLEMARSLQGMVIIIWFCMLIIIPILTMRSFAEERKSGTFETLFTAPVHNTTVVLSKFFGIWGFFVLMCLPTLAYPFIIRALDPSAAIMLLIGGSPLLISYTTIALIAATFIALGMLFSSLTSNQIIAAIGTFAIMGILFFGALIEPTISKSMAVREICSYVSSALHLMEGARGIFDTRSVIFYLTTTIFFLFCTVKAVENRR